MIRNVLFVTVQGFKINQYSCSSCGGCGTIMKIYYCKKCNWRIEVEPDEAIRNKCSNCGNHGLFFVDGGEKEIEEFFSGQPDSKATKKELCPYCGGTGFKMITTYEGNKEFHTLSSTPRKCNVCSKHCNVDDLKITGENKRECRGFADRGETYLEQDLESLGFWDCKKCGNRNIITPDTIKLLCDKCRSPRKFNISVDNKK